MSQKDIRWIQRFQNFKKAFAQLEMAVLQTQKRDLSELEKQGLIQCFEFTHELSWNVLKDYFKYQGNNSITGSRDAFREAFKQGLVENGEVWMDMIKSRNLTTHTYNEAVTNKITKSISESYFDQFSILIKKLEEHL